MGSCDWTGCRFRDVPAPSGGIVKLKSKESFSRRASQQQIQNERFAEIIEGWKRQNENLDRELTAYRAQKSDSKQRLEEKNSGINLLRRQNEKLESLLRKCEIQINKLLEAKAKENESKLNSSSQLIESKNREKNLELKIEDVNKQLYNIKNERNKLLNETFNLRQNNKQLAIQLNVRAQGIGTVYSVL